MTKITSRAASYSMAPSIFMKLLTIFVVHLSIFFTFSAHAIDGRVTIEKYSFLAQNEQYQLVIFNSNPQAWDGSPTTVSEGLTRHYTDQFLRSVQQFLYDRHRADGKSETGSDLDRYILQSFKRRPDPFNQLQFTDAGRGMHKVDEYYEYKSLVLGLYRLNGTNWEMNGTVKFVEADVARENTDLLEDLAGFVPLAIGAANASSASQLAGIQYENLAKSENGPSPVPLLLYMAAATPFFQRYAHDESVHIFLNAEAKVAPYHINNFGFSIMPGVFGDLPAERLSCSVPHFIQSVESYARTKMVSTDMPTDLVRSTPSYQNMCAMILGNGFDPNIW